VGKKYIGGRVIYVLLYRYSKGNVPFLVFFNVLFYYGLKAHRLLTKVHQLLLSFQGIVEFKYIAILNQFHSVAFFALIVSKLNN